MYVGKRKTLKIQDSFPIRVSWVKGTEERLHRYHPVQYVSIHSIKDFENYNYNYNSDLNLKISVLSGQKMSKIYSNMLFV